MTDPKKRLAAYFNAPHHTVNIGLIEKLKAGNPGIEQYTDVDIEETYHLWKMRMTDDNSTLLEWLDEKGKHTMPNTSVTERLDAVLDAVHQNYPLPNTEPAEQTVEDSESDLLLNVLGPDLHEQVFGVADTEQVVTGSTVVSETTNVLTRDYSVSVQSVQEKPDPEDLSRMQLLSVAVDDLQRRRRDDIVQTIIKLLGPLFNMQLSSEADVLVTIAENSRLSAMVIELLRKLNIQYSATVVSSDLSVSGQKIKFADRTSRHSLVTLEQGMIQASINIQNMQKRDEEATKILDELARSTKKILELTDTANQFRAELEKLRAEAGKKNVTVPIVGKDGNHIVCVGWKVKLKDGESPVQMYLKVVKNAKPMPNGFYRTADFCRTSNRQFALEFSNMEMAQKSVDRILKNIAKVSSTSKLTANTFNVAHLIQDNEVYHPFVVSKEPK